MNNIWIYGLGFSSLCSGYFDLIDMNKIGIRGATYPHLNTIFEFIAGIGHLLFFVWGFFVFQWWVPIVVPLICWVPATLIRRLTLNIPHLLVLLGYVLCIYSLLSK